MNRDIKFRGKCLENNKWVYGNYVHYKDDDNKEVYCIVSTRFNTIAAGLDFIEVNPETVGQFTGLVDKNFVEVYENDIIQSNYKVNGMPKKGYISWLKQECGFVIVWKNYDSRLGHRNRGGGYEYDNSIEVIGNVFDNSELLKGGDNA